jgi:hypothetical protein
MVSGTPGRRSAVTKSDAPKDGLASPHLHHHRRQQRAGGGQRATLTDTFPAGFGGATGVHVQRGSSCLASGSGNIAATMTLLVGGTATFGHRHHAAGTSPP